MEKTYLIGYDLNRPGKNYDDLIKAIKSLSGTWWNHLDSTWIVKTSTTAEQIRNSLRAHMDGSDELLVVLLSREAAWVGFNQSGSDWLEQNL